MYRKKKLEKFKVDCYNILTVGTYSIGFDINIIGDLGFTIILYLFLLNIFLEGEY